MSEELKENDVTSSMSLKRKRLKKISEKSVEMNDISEPNAPNQSDTSSEEDGMSEESTDKNKEKIGVKDKESTNDKNLPRKKRGRSTHTEQASQSRPRRTSRRDSFGSYNEKKADLDYSQFEEFRAAQQAGFNPLEMIPEEISFFPGYVEYNQPRYLDLRNTILYKWKNDVHHYLSLKKAKENIKDELLPEIEPIWDFLTRHGHINSGIYQNWEEKKVHFEGDPPRIVIIGAGASGLCCAQQLHQWGYRVTVIEARSRIGGRCNTTNDLDPTFSVDIGASIITGLIGNPLDNITKQLQLRTHVIGTSALMITETGNKIDKEVDDKMEILFNKLLEKAATFKDPKSADKSLGIEMEKILPRLPPVEAGILDWYYANLEYACAADLSLLSLNYWDQDDPFGFDGDHLMLVDGYASMVKPLIEGLDIRLDHKVSKISTDVKGITIFIEDGTTIDGDIVIVTVPLGVLKTDMITFDPPLPVWKKEAIRNLGFGLLNKVAILFEEKFWDDDIDWFGKVITNNVRENRGLCYLWWNYYKVLKKPLLVAIVAGKACHSIELRKDEDIIQEATTLLKNMFHISELPKIVKYIITRWKSECFTGGSYSYVALGATGEDYDKLAKPVQVSGKNRIFFAGEHTCRQYPASVAGAYASGLREAEKVHKMFCPPISSTFRPPPIQSDIDKSREANRKRMVKKSQKASKARVPRFRRGVRRLTLNIGKSGNEMYKFNYQYLFKKQNTSNNNNIEENDTQFKKYDALLFKKRKREEEETTQKRNVAQSRDGRIWYSVKGLPTLFSDINFDNNNNISRLNSSGSFSGLTSDGSSDNLQINPYGSFRQKEEKHHDSEKKSPGNDNINNSLEMSDDEKGGKVENKSRREFREQTADLIVNRLSRYHKNRRIPDKEDFKHLSRKFTHKFITWEDNNNGNYKMDPKKKAKMKKIIDEYFQRHKVYKRKKSGTKK